MSGACAKDVDKIPVWKESLDKECLKHDIRAGYLWPRHTDNMTKKKVEEDDNAATLPPVWTYQFAAKTWDGIKKC